MGAQNGLDGKASQFGMVVFVTKVAKPDTSKVRGGIFDEGLSTFIIAQVAFRSADALLQMARISTLRQFLGLIVGLQDEVVSRCNTLLNLLCDMTTIGYQTETDTLANNTVARTVGAVMRNSEGGDSKFAYLLGFTFLQIEEVLLVDLSAHAPIAMHSSMYVCRGKDGNMAITTQRSYRLDMVGMIVGKKNMLDVVEFETILVEMLFERANANTTVYHQTVCVGE